MEKVSRGMTLGVSLICGVLGYAIGSQSASNESDRERIAFLEKELQSRNSAVPSAQSRRGAVSFAPSAGGGPGGEAQSKNSALPKNYRQPEDDLQTTLEENAEQALLNYDSFLTLSDAEREQLKASLIDKPDLTDEARITELFGAAKWDEYSKSLKKVEEEGETNAREFEVFQLSRRLKLTPEQSQHIDEALQKVAKEFPADGSGDSAIDPALPPKEIARILKIREAAAIEAEQKRARRTKELLQQILPEPQFNAYLEYAGENADVSIPEASVTE